MLEICLGGKFLCTEISPFLYFTAIALWICYKYKCNTATNTKIIKTWVFWVDPIYCRYFEPAIYDLPINLRYIHKRVPALIHTLFTKIKASSPLHLQPNPLMLHQLMLLKKSQGCLHPGKMLRVSSHLRYCILSARRALWFLDEDP